MPRFGIISNTDQWSDRRLDIVAGLLILVGFLFRLWAAADGFVNPDEAYHVLLASPEDFASLYKSAVRSPHPPLFIILLHYIRQITTSDLGIRLIPLLAGSLFPWVIYRWISRGWSKHAGIAALAALTFAPALIQLSIEARGYTMALLFMSIALYMMDSAIEHSSPLRMAGFALALFGAILSDFSAAFFTVAAGAYFLLRIREKQVTQDVRIVWELSQVGAVVIYAVLWVTQVYPMKAIAATRSDVEGWLRDCYPQTGDNPVVFVVLNTARQFAFLFPLLVPAVAAILLFFIGAWLLWRRSAPNKIWHSRALVMLMFIPFGMACLGSFLYMFPYGRSRHTVFLALFIVMGVSVTLDRIGRKWIIPLALLGAIGMTSWHLTLGRHRGLIARADNSKSLMAEALRFLEEEIPRDRPILVESELRVVLAYYLEEGKRPPELYGSPSEEPIGGFRFFAARWGYSDPQQLRDDLRLLRGEYGYGPEEEIWVLDGGFLTLLENPVISLHQKGEIQELHRFGRAMVAFKTPPGFMWEQPGPGDVVPKRDPGDDALPAFPEYRQGATE